MSDRVSKELSASAISLSKSRECFIEVYIDNRCIIVIIYKIPKVEFTHAIMQYILCHHITHKHNDTQNNHLV
jgi:hypothetical protein